MKITAIAWLVLLLVLSHARLDASETVCKLGPGPGSMIPTYACGGPVQVATPADVAASTSALENKFNQKLADSTQQLRGNIDKGLSDAEVRLKADLTDAVNKLPQRLLSDAAKKEIEDTLRAEMKAEIEQMRKDLQQQIDGLKHPASSRPVKSKN